MRRRSALRALALRGSLPASCAAAAAVRGRLGCSTCVAQCGSFGLPSGASASQQEATRNAAALGQRRGRGWSRGAAYWSATLPVMPCTQRMLPVPNHTSESSTFSVRPQPARQRERGGRRVSTCYGPLAPFAQPTRGIQTLSSGMAEKPGDQSGDGDKAATKTTKRRKAFTPLRTLDTLPILTVVEVLAAEQALRAAGRDGKLQGQRAQRACGAHVFALESIWACPV